MHRRYGGLADSAARLCAGTLGAARGTVRGWYCRAGTLYL